MTKEEFAEKLKDNGSSRHFNGDDYDKINYVYTFHPSISEVDGKEQIAYLFGTFGMRIIKDMYPAAKQAEAYEAKIRSLRGQLEDLKNDFQEFKEGTK